MKNKKNVVIKKGSHSRTSLSGIFHARRYQTKCHSRVSLSGISSLFSNHSFTARSVTPQKTYRLGVSPTGAASKLWNTCHKAGNLSGLYPTYKGCRAFTLQKTYRLGVSPTGAASKLWDTCHKAGNLSGLHPTYKGCRAFTLIELLVVVLIIGILAAVALPQYQFAVEKTKFTRLIAVGRNIWFAQKRYQLENGSYTRNLSQLDVQLDTNTYDISSPSDAYISIIDKKNPHIWYWVWFDGKRTCAVGPNGTQLQKKVCDAIAGQKGYQASSYQAYFVSKNIPY